MFLCIAYVDRFYPIETTRTVYNLEGTYWPLLMDVTLQLLTHGSLYVSRNNYIEPSGCRSMCSCV